MGWTFLVACGRNREMSSEGFEPPTCPSEADCAIRLRHEPKRFAVAIPLASHGVLRKAGLAQLKIAPPYPNRQNNCKVYKVNITGILIE